VLADGEPPGGAGPALSRGALERLARHANRGGRARTLHENRIARLLRRATSVRRAAAAGRRAEQASAAGDRAYFQLKQLLPAATLASLLDRVAVDLERG
jgi:hypothetical protein